MKSSLILCGMPCAGKTTVGRAVAAHRNLPFIDTDLLIEQSQKKSCREIVLSEGEPLFRKIEQTVIAASDWTASVVALGGGALECVGTRERVQTAGTLIYLKTSFDTLLTRLSARGFPPFIDGVDSFRALFERREALFVACSDYVVETDGCTPSAVSQTVEEMYGF